MTGGMTGPSDPPPRSPAPADPVRRVFVTGTDTGVGKTVVAAALVRAWQGAYWKPVQTGLAEETGDSAVVARLAGIGPERLHPPRYALQAPLSPQAAAALENQSLSLEAFDPPNPIDHRPLVIEGAGGVMVPLTDDALMIDLIVRLAAPVVIVARSTLGTVNHTLLTLAALRARAVTVAGVILNGPPNPGNRAALEQFGRVRILAELPPQQPLDAASLARFARDHLPPLAALSFSP